MPAPELASSSKLPPLDPDSDTLSFDHDHGETPYFSPNPKGKWGAMKGKCVENLEFLECVATTSQKHRVDICTAVGVASDKLHPMIVRRFAPGKWDGFHTENYLFASSSHLRPLQGLWVPEIITMQNEPGGYLCVCEEPLSRTTWSRGILGSDDFKKCMLNAYRAIHRQGVLHNSYDPADIVFAESKHSLVQPTPKSKHSPPPYRVHLTNFRQAQSTVSSRTVALRPCTQDEIRLEQRRIAFLLDFEDARAKEWLKWTTPQNGVSDAQVWTVCQERRRVRSPSNPQPKTKFEVWDPVNERFRVWDDRASWFEDGLPPATRPTQLVQRWTIAMRNSTPIHAPPRWSQCPPNVPHDYEKALNTYEKELKKYPDPTSEHPPSPASASDATATGSDIPTSPRPFGRVPSRDQMPPPPLGRSSPLRIGHTAPLLPILSNIPAASLATSSNPQQQPLAVRALVPLPRQSSPPTQYTGDLTIRASRAPAPSPELEDPIVEEGDRSDLAQVCPPTSSPTSSLIATGSFRRSVSPHGLATPPNSPPDATPRDIDPDSAAKSELTDDDEECIVEEMLNGLDDPASPEGDDLDMGNVDDLDDDDDISTITPSTSGAPPATPPPHDEKRALNRRLHAGLNRRVPAMLFATATRATPASSSASALTRRTSRPVETLQPRQTALNVRRAARIQPEAQSTPTPAAEPLLPSLFPLRGSRAFGRRWRNEARRQGHSFSEPSPLDPSYASTLVGDGARRAYRAWLSSMDTPAAAALLEAMDRSTPSPSIATSLNTTPPGSTFAPSTPPSASNRVTPRATNPPSSPTAGSLEDFTFQDPAAVPWIGFMPAHQWTHSTPEERQTAEADKGASYSYTEGRRTAAALFSTAGTSASASSMPTSSPATGPSSAGPSSRKRRREHDSEETLSNDDDATLVGSESELMEDDNSDAWSTTGVMNWDGRGDDEDTRSATAHNGSSNAGAGDDKAGGRPRKRLRFV